MSTLLQDLRFAVRHFAHHPAFTAVAVLTIALGFGVNVQLFAVVKAVLLQPVPGVPRSGDLQVLASLRSGGRPGPMSHPDFRDFRDRLRGFESLAASVPVPMTLAAKGARGERVWGELVSGGYFDMLGVRPQQGRLLTSDDDRMPGGHPVVVVSDHLWRQRLGGDPAILGRTLRIHGQTFEVVGVTPAGFRGSLTGMGLDLFVPLAMQPRVYPVGDLLEARDRSWLQVKGRLAAGVSRQAAEDEARALARALAASRAEGEGAGESGGDAAAGTPSRTVRIYDISASPLSGAAMLLPLVAILVVLTVQVLLVTAANVTNLFQARLLGRRRELAVRKSQGATRRRLIRQILTESLLLALAGGGVGLLVGWWIQELVDRRPIPVPLPVHFGNQIDARVVVFVLLSAAVMGVALGWAPAWRASRPRVLEALRGEAGGLEGKRRGSFLVVTQVAFSLVPLICAGLLVRSSQNAVHLDPGFRTDGVLLATLERPAGEDGWQTYARAREAATRLPGVDAVALGHVVPLSLRSRTRPLTPVGYRRDEGEDTIFGYNLVSEGYFRALEMPLLRGRDFAPADDASGSPVVVVNQALARRFWPDEPAGEVVGEQVRVGSMEATVIGVVTDARVEKPAEAPAPFFYLPYRQHPPREMTLHLVTDRPAAALYEELARAMEDLHPELALVDTIPLHRHVEASWTILRSLATGLAVGGLISVLLAAAGLYGVMLQAVSRRTREIGVRMALGARRGEAVWRILRDGLHWTALGLVLGTGMALVATRFLRSFLLDVSPLDPGSFVAAALALTAIAGLAAWLPARRAARIEPLDALRVE